MVVGDIVWRNAQIELVIVVEAPRDGTASGSVICGIVGLLKVGSNLMISLRLSFNRWS